MGRWHAVFLIRSCGSVRWTVHLLSVGSRDGVSNRMAVSRPIAGQPFGLIISGMSERRFFCPVLSEGRCELPEEEARHALTVLRLGQGDAIVLFDGQGRVATASIASANRKRVVLDVLEIRRLPPELPVRVTLAVAMIKATRQSYLVEKCTELGVSEIIPIETQRGVVHAGEASVEKWQRRAIEAAKQSKRAWVPRISSDQRAKKALEAVSSTPAVVADLGEASIPLIDFLTARPNLDSLMVWIGPEGGWAAEERAAFAAAGVQPVRLAATVLRTETAAISACAIIAAHCLTRQQTS